MGPPAGAEDRLHRWLALILGAVAGAVLFARGPGGARAPGAAASATAARPDGADTLSRPVLDAAIAQLARWLERSSPAAATPLATHLRLLALGGSALDHDEAARPRSPVWQNLESLAALADPGAHPASLEPPVGDIAERDAGAIATLAILLEAGVPLERELLLASGEVSVGRLLELTLPTLSARRDSSDPWALDLLSFAVLGGLPGRRDELERQALSSLARLERAQRRVTALQGDGPPAASVMEPLVTELRERAAAGADAERELQLSAAVFRAVAVLAEPALERRALRHLNALLFRHRLERDAHRVLLERAQTPSERISVHLDAIESLGRLEQALYGAHLAFRRGAHPGPAPRTAASMRRAARDLLEHLQALRQSGVFEAGGVPRDGLSRAAVQALRGLRAARIAT